MAYVPWGGYRRLVVAEQSNTDVHRARKGRDEEIAGAPQRGEHGVEGDGGARQAVISSREGNPVIGHDIGSELQSPPSTPSLLPPLPLIPPRRSSVPSAESRPSNLKEENGVEDRDAFTQREAERYDVGEQQDRAQGVSLSPDGTLLAVLTTRRVQVWRGGAGKRMLACFGNWRDETEVLEKKHRGRIDGDGDRARRAVVQVSNEQVAWNCESNLLAVLRSSAFISRKGAVLDTYRFISMYKVVRVAHEQDGHKEPQQQERVEILPARTVHVQEKVGGIALMATCVFSSAHAHIRWQTCHFQTEKYSLLDGVYLVSGSAIIIFIPFQSKESVRCILFPSLHLSVSPSPAPSYSSIRPSHKKDAQDAASVLDFVVGYDRTFSDGRPSPVPSPISSCLDAATCTLRLWAVLVLSDGRVAAGSLPSPLFWALLDPTERVARSPLAPHCYDIIVSWLPPPDDYERVALNMTHRLVAASRESGSIGIFVLSSPPSSSSSSSTSSSSSSATATVNGSIRESHLSPVREISLTPWGILPASTGSVAHCLWSHDGSSLAVSWASGCAAVWARHGSRLYFQGWSGQGGMNSGEGAELEGRDSLLSSQLPLMEVYGIAWDLNGHALLLLASEKLRGPGSSSSWEAPRLALPSSMSSNTIELVEVAFAVPASIMCCSARHSLQCVYVTANAFLTLKAQSSDHQLFENVQYEKVRAWVGAGEKEESDGREWRQGGGDSGERECGDWSEDLALFLDHPSLRADPWTSVPFPQEYLSSFAPIRIVCPSWCGRWCAAAGSHGIIIYSESLRAWIGFSKREMASFSVISLCWVCNIVILLAVNWSDMQYEILCFDPSKPLLLQSCHYKVILRKRIDDYSRGVPLSMDCEGSAMIVFTDDGFLYQYRVNCVTQPFPPLPSSALPSSLSSSFSHSPPIVKDFLVPGSHTPSGRRGSSSMVQSVDEGHVLLTPSEHEEMYRYLTRGLDVWLEQRDLTSYASQRETAMTDVHVVGITPTQRISMYHLHHHPTSIQILSRHFWPSPLPDPPSVLTSSSSTSDLYTPRKSPSKHDLGRRPSSSSSSSNIISKYSLERLPVCLIHTWKDNLLHLITPTGTCSVASGSVQDYGMVKPSWRLDSQGDWMQCLGEGRCGKEYWEGLDATHLFASAEARWIDGREGNGEHKGSSGAWYKRLLLQGHRSGGEEESALHNGMPMANQNLIFPSRERAEPEVCKRMLWVFGDTGFRVCFPYPAFVSTNASKLIPQPNKGSSRSSGREENGKETDPSVGVTNDGGQKHTHHDSSSDRSNESDDNNSHDMGRRKDKNNRDGSKGSKGKGAMLPISRLITCIPVFDMDPEVLPLHMPFDMGYVHCISRRESDHIALSQYPFLHAVLFALLRLPPSQYQYYFGPSQKAGIPDMFRLTAQQESRFPFLEGVFPEYGPQGVMATAMTICGYFYDKTILSHSLELLLLFAVEEEVKRQKKMKESERKPDERGKEVEQHETVEKEKQNDSNGFPTEAEGVSAGRARKEEPPASPRENEKARTASTLVPALQLVRLVSCQHCGLKGTLSSTHILPFHIRYRFYCAVVIASARKMNPSNWLTLFRVAGQPRKLFRYCVDTSGARCDDSVGGNNGSSNNNSNNNRYSSSPINMAAFKQEMEKRVGEELLEKSRINDIGLDIFIQEEKQKANVEREGHGAHQQQQEEEVSDNKGGSGCKEGPPVVEREKAEVEGEKNMSNILLAATMLPVIAEVDGVDSYLRCSFELLQIATTYLRLDLIESILNQLNGALSTAREGESTVSQQFKPKLQSKQGDNDTRKMEGGNGGAAVGAAMKRGAEAQAEMVSQHAACVDIYVWKFLRKRLQVYDVITVSRFSPFLANPLRTYLLRERVCFSPMKDLPRAILTIFQSVNTRNIFLLPSIPDLRGTIGVTGGHVSNESEIGCLVADSILSFSRENAESEVLRQRLQLTLQQQRAVFLESIASSPIRGNSNGYGLELEEEEESGWRRRRCHVQRFMEEAHCAGLHLWVVVCSISLLDVDTVSFYICDRLSPSQTSQLLISMEQASKEDSRVRIISNALRESVSPILSTPT